MVPGGETLDRGVVEAGRYDALPFGAACCDRTADREEREVLLQLSALQSTQEVAETMFVSVNTVRTHVGGILRTLGANQRK